MAEGWHNVKIMLFGKEIKVTEVKWVTEERIEDLHQQLKQAEADEDYELCAKIKKYIDNYNK